MKKKGFVNVSIVIERKTMGLEEVEMMAVVVEGYSQRKSVDFNEIFSHVVKMSSIRTVLSLAFTFDLEVEQMDVKTTFLHGDLEEEIYMKQLNGFHVEGKENYVCRLRKSLHGLKHAMRQWYKKY